MAEVIIHGYYITESPYLKLAENFINGVLKCG